MTNFNDVTHTFTDGLDQISAYIPKFVEHLQAGDKAFRQHKDDLTGYHQISFYGQGASAFATSVEHNIARVKSFVDNWNTLALDSTNLSAQITRSNEEANSKLNLMYMPPVEEIQALEHYSYPNGIPYTIGVIWQDMQEAALKSSDMNTVMDKGLSSFTSKLDTQQQDILANITVQHNRKMSQFKGPSDPNANTEVLYYTLAQRGVNALHTNLSDVITTWFHEITPLLTEYEQGISNNKVLVAAYTPPGAQLVVTTPGKWGNVPWKSTYTTGPSGSFTPLDPTSGNLGISGTGKTVIEGWNGVLGNTQFAGTGGVELDGPSGNFQVGKTDGGFGLSGVASLVSVTGTAGVNIAGANVGVTGTVGLQFGLGFTVKDHTLQVNLPFFSGGLTFAPAQ